jgi:hypothetical protein
MKQKQAEITEKAWISRFWVQYVRLPEPFKEEFINLARCLAQKTGSKAKDGNYYESKHVGQH